MQILCFCYYVEQDVASVRLKSLTVFILSWVQDSFEHSALWHPLYTSEKCGNCRILSLWNVLVSHFLLLSVIVIYFVKEVTSSFWKYVQHILGSYFPFLIFWSLSIRSPARFFFVIKLVSSFVGEVFLCVSMHIDNRKIWMLRN